MGAVYPSSIKTFAYRQDYTELVEAADVNTAYDEIRALQTTLGVLPNTDTIDGAVNTWTTTGSRITAVREGVSKPYANVSAHNKSIPYAVPVTLSWTSKTWDTHSMWQGGSQLVCPRSGVYTFDIYMRWHADATPNDSQQPAFNRNGTLDIAMVPVGGTANSVNQNGAFPIGWQKSTHQSASITAPWQKGTAVQMIVLQSCYTSPLIATGVCSITYHRDPPTLNNL